MQGVARNAPCPCGSGVKHKRCCLSLLEEAARQERADEAVFARICDWVADQHRDRYEEAAAKTRFERMLRGPVVRQLCAIWAIVDYAPADGDPPLAARYAARPGLQAAERDAARRIVSARLGAYRVRDVVAGAWLDLAPLGADERIRAIAPAASASADVGDIVVARLTAGPHPVVWGGGALHGAATARKWARRFATLPTDPADAALALATFQPDDHAEPLEDALARPIRAMALRDEELVLEALEEDPHFTNIGQEIVGGWAFAWRGADPPLEARASWVLPDDAALADAPRVVVDGNGLALHARDEASVGEVSRHLARELGDLIVPAVELRSAA